MCPDSVKTSEPREDAMKAVLGRGPRVGIWGDGFMNSGQMKHGKTYDEVGRDFLAGASNQFTVFGLDIIDSFAENEVNPSLEQALVHHPSPSVGINIVEKELSTVNHRNVLRLEKRGELASAERINGTYWEVVPELSRIL